MKKFIRFRVRWCLCILFATRPLISTHEFITLVGSRQRNFNKCRISAIYQPAEQNLLNVENIFKDTVDLRECTPENSLNGLFEVQPNYKTMKRM